jgi:NAD(P)-dependent dehydrogenase (short-subunit alcohol dehydrogenase family)/aryl carrier-like protein
MIHNLSRKKVCTKPGTVQVAWRFVSLLRALHDFRNRLADQVSLVVWLSHNSPPSMHNPADEQLCDGRAVDVLPGLVSTVERESRWLTCRIVWQGDGTGQPEWPTVWNELRTLGGQHVAYRGGQRFERGLRMAPLEPAGQERQGGLTLVTGGLGGVGWELSRAISAAPGTSVLAIGRRPRSYPGFSARLSQTSRISYQQVDVTDESGLRAAIEQAEAESGMRLSRVFHLAGVFDERYLLEEDRAHLASVLNAKTAGAQVLGRIVQTKPDCSLTVFSSVNGTFGGLGAGAYSAASSFVEGFTRRLRASGIRARSLTFSAWRGIGMSAATSPDTLAASGMDALSRDDGLTSLEIASRCSATANMLIGLDPTALPVASLLNEPCHGLDMLVAVHQRFAWAGDAPQLPPLSDEFGTPIAWTWRQLANLPCDATGQPDAQRLRTALELPDADHGAPPAGSQERAVVRLVEEVLHVRPAGMNDRLFDLGADSLGIALLLERARAQFGVLLPRSELFANPTLSSLVQRLAAPDAEPEQTAPATSKPQLSGVARPGAIDDKSELTPSQLNVYEQCVAHPESWTFNMPLSLVLRGSVDTAALGQALNDVVQRHESLRTVFFSTDGGPRQQVLAQVRPGFRVVDGLEMQSDELARLVTAEEHTPFDLTHGPMIRLTLINRPDEMTVALLTTHHIVFDGSSYPPFLADLSRAFNARAVGLAPQYEPLPTRFADYVDWHRTFIGSPEVLRQRGFWREALRDFTPVDVAPDQDIACADPRDGRYIELAVPEGFSSRLRAVCAELQVTPFTVLTAGLAAVIQRLTGARETAIGTIVSGRSRADLRLLTGFFTNAVVLRTDPAADQSFAQLITAQQQVVLDALDNQDLPFGEVIEDYPGAWDKGRDNPFYQIALVLQKDPLSNLHLNGISVSRYREGYDIARGDLVVEFEERHGSYAGGVYFDRNRFTQQHVQEIGALLVRIVDEGLRDPDLAVQRLGRTLGDGAQH